MKWQLKALAQLAFSGVPFGERLNYFFQRHMTRTLPTGDARFISIVLEASEHIDAFRRHGVRPIEEATFYEFGAGWDLLIPLAFYALGVNRQILVDIRPLLRREMVNETIVKFQRLPLHVPLMRKPSRPLEDGDPSSLPAALRREYEIDYLAPHDARATGLPAGAVGYITSTNTLEHIPPPDIRAILFECHRLLGDDGLMSVRIDYQDHYAYFDRSISVYNFLRYPDWLWHALYSSALHYQNRLRHRDYLALFKETGWAVVEARCTEGTDADLDELVRLPLAPRFEAYSIQELVVRNAVVVLRKA